MAITTAAAVRRHRYLAGLTQTQLAENAGITQSTVSDIESGRTSPSAPTLKAIADALGRSVEDLLPDEVPA